jgi:predicted CoA-substrate-specific enzyme activase
MKYSLGIDVGSVNAKLCLTDGHDRIVRLDNERITTNSKAAINALLSRLSEVVPLENIGGAGVSGSGRDSVPGEFNWAEYSSSLAIASGLLNSFPDVKTVVQIGGQTSTVIVLEDGLKKPWKVSSNPLCAAGTGRFLEQQAYRLGISLEDFAHLALKCQGDPPRIAARCSVFAKSDLIHLQQKGVSVEAMLYALCESIARMVASLKKGTFEEPVYFVGGVAANSAIVRALNETISARNGHEVQVIVPENYQHVESLGAALLAKEKDSIIRPLDEPDAHQDYFEMPRLEKVAVPGNGTSLKISEPCLGYLGVDVGSTSTKAVIMDETGTEVLAKNYLMTAGRPIDAVKQVFRNLLLDGASNVRIAGAGVTGSGRYLVGSFIGADLIKNEITAQTRAAADIDPEADIIEIGGQDSKLVIKRNGVVVDYQMNKACAAGTGSFIDELAEMLGISVNNGEFAELSFNAPYTIDLGTRCASFMGQAVASAQKEGVPLEVITASLSNSIAKNYLSKVVGHRKLGDKVILTGAVFYNQAVVSAFHQQLEGKKLAVAEHREVSGAIGAALLAREELNGQKSKFKGFQQVVKGECNLSTFICKGCDNNCTITRMQLADEKATFYGSRCDRYDSAISQARQKTAFDEREKLLFRDYEEGAGTGPVVGIPRALLAYDYAPLLIGFLNELGVKVVLSTKTTKEIMEKAAELSYTDSCFPVKLLHGHIAAIKDNVDYILYPSFLRLDNKEGAENQKYACPLIQASPFIVRHVLNLGDKLLAPIIDFSLGDDETVKNLTGVAVKLGFGRRKGKEAALAGIRAQRRFTADCLSTGRKLLRQLRDGDQLGVVLFSRSYMSQDSGANLGIAEKLAQLGVAPIPLDFLPLESIDPKAYSDRPYWYYESKFIAGGEITVNDQQLYGLAITNFGCGPNSFMLNLLADIMGGKPLGELEIDEHAAEAGIVTRLEAYVDTIKSYAQATKHLPETDRQIYRGASTIINPKKTLLLPRMCPHADVIAEAVNASGARAIVLPEPDERNLLFSNQVTFGTECLPYRVTLGDFIKFCHDCGDDLKHYEGFMAGAYGPCRLGKYVVEQDRILKELGFDLPMIASVSNNAYRDLNLGSGFTRLAWNAIVAVDGLQRLLWRTRPYEKEKGSAEALFDEFLKRIAERVRRKEPFYDVLQQATAAFISSIDPELPPRPLVGINGEIYLRSNRFSNHDLVKECEEAGLEVIVSPVGEWMKYTAHRNLEDAVKDRNFRKILSSYLKKLIQERDEHKVADYYHELLNGRESSTAAILAKSDMYLSPRCGSEAVLSIGSGVEWMESPVFAGVISVMPHGCMPGGIVAAMAERFSATYQKPWISLTYDGFLETNNAARISNFAELLRFCRQEASTT